MKVEQYLEENDDEQTTVSDLTCHHIWLLFHRRYSFIWEYNLMFEIVDLRHAQTQQLSMKLQSLPQGKKNKM